MSTSEITLKYALSIALVSVVALMACLYLLTQEAKAKGRQARLDMIAKYSPEVIGKLLLDHFYRVLTAIESRAKAEHEEL